MSSTFAHSIPQGKIVLTYDNYRDLPNDQNRYEILDGELSVTPAPSTKHQRISFTLCLPNTFLPINSATSMRRRLI